MGSEMFMSEEMRTDRILRTPEEKHLDKLEGAEDRLVKNTFNLIDVRGDAGLPADSDFIQGVIKEQVRRWGELEWKGDVPPDGAAQLRSTYRKRLASIGREIAANKKHDEASTSKAMERGAVIFPNDVYRTEDQIAAIKGDRTFGSTDEQVYSRAVRLGKIPDSEFGIVTSLQSNGELREVVEDQGAAQGAGLSEDTRLLLKSFFDRRYYGGADLDEERLEPGWFDWMNGIPGGRMVKKAVGTLLGGFADVLTAPGRGVAAGPASQLRQRREQGALRYVQTAGIPTEEQIEGIDLPKKRAAMSEWERTKHDFQRGGTPWDKDEIESKHLVRYMGLTSEQANKLKLNTDAGRVIKAIAGGTVYSSEAPTQTDEYARILDAYTVAAENGIRQLKPSDPRYARYFGETDNDRAREAMKITIEAAGEGAAKDDIVRAAQVLYAAMPRQKMLEDMLALDKKGWEIKHPDLADLAHQIIFDPIWGVNLFKGFKVGAGFVVKGADKALTTVAPKTMAAGKGAINPLIDGFQRGFRHWTHTDEAIKQVGTDVAKMSDEARTASRVKDLDSLEDSVRLTMQVAEGQGAGAAAQISKKAQIILYHLAKVKSPKAREALWLVLEGKMQLDTALAKGLLTLRQAARVPHIKRVSTEVYELIKNAKQLDTLKDGFIHTAIYEKFYVPRVVGDTRDLHNIIVKAGFTDLVDAAARLFPKGASTLSRRLKELDASYKTIGDGYKALMQAAKNGDETAKIFQLSTQHQRELREIGALRATLDKDSLHGVHSFMNASSTKDALGANSAHHFIHPTTGRAIERKGVAALYPWLKDPYMQWESAIRGLVSKGRRSAEIKALVDAFGITKVAGIIAKDTGMIKIAPNGYKGMKSSERMRLIHKMEKGLTEQMGLEMVALDGAMAKRAAPAIIESGGKFTKDGIIFVPKVMSNRMNSLWGVAGSKNLDDVARGFIKFRNEVIRPTNSVFRLTRTVARAPAFHALNYFGAVGLGVLAHGTHALNPKLQFAAHRAAIFSAFGGSEKALGMRLSLAKGGSVSIGEFIQAAADFGLVHQGAAKYAFDIASKSTVKGNPLRSVERYSRWMAKITRTQQIAEAADDYQKFIAFMGWYMRHGSAPKGGKFRLQDMQKAVAFTSEYAGNYNRLSQFEKTWMRDGFTFYSWNRFIMPHLARQVFENPRRMAAFEKMTQAIRADTKGNAPGITGLGIPPHLWMQRGFVAPKFMQPKRGQAGPHEFGMAVIETPIASQAMFAGGFYGEGPVQAMMGPIAWGLVGMFTGFDHTGNRSWQKEFLFPTLDDFGSFGAAKDYLYRADESAIGRNILQTVSLPGASLEAYMNLAQLYMNNGMENEATELWLRYRVGRDFLGLDNLVAKSLGYEGRSLPGYGLFRGYGVNPEATAARHQGLIMKRAGKN